MSDLPADFPAFNALDANPHNLPVQLTGFIGREEGINQLIGLLSTARPVTLLGAGGSGKKSLVQGIGVLLVS